MTALVLLALAPAAHAGIADSPLPVLVTGVKTLHVYSVTGVIETGGLGTYFACTSTSTASQQVAVELFQPNVGGGPVGPDNNAFATQWTLNPGETVLFGTAAAPGVLISQGLGGSANGAKGSARILSTSKLLICTAYVIDKTSA